MILKNNNSIVLLLTTFITLKYNVVEYFFSSGIELSSAFDLVQFVPISMQAYGSRAKGFVQHFCDETVLHCYNFERILSLLIFFYIV